MIVDIQAPELTNLTSEYLPQAVALSSALGWPYRLEDWAFAHSLGDGLALVKSGRLIGTAMRWSYGADFTSIGMIIIDKEFKGKGYGAQIFDSLLTGTESNTVFLNSTAEAVNLYRNRGFISTGLLYQHQGVPIIGEKNPMWSKVRSAEAADFPLMVELDQRSLGMRRKDLLSSLAEHGQLTLIFNDGIVTGYAACRSFGRGYVIGPVVANTLEDARALIGDAMSRLQGRFVRVDTSAESGLSQWLESSGLKCVDTATPMIRGKPPECSEQARTFALCSQSLG